MAKYSDDSVVSFTVHVLTVPAVVLQMENKSKQVSFTSYSPNGLEFQRCM